jgi:predicted N-formylglutamate amidohydrolase
MEAVVIAGLRERVVVTVHSNTPSIMIGVMRQV